MKRMLLVVSFLLPVFALSQSTAATSAKVSSAKPLILEKNEGDLRVRRPGNLTRPTPQFMLKVSPRNNGSEHLVLGTEEIPPGGLIPRHKHLGQDEILLILTGQAHVWLGNQERDVHAGGVVFIPSDTWISLRNTGTVPMGLAFVFSAPGFEDYMRCASVPAGAKADPLTDSELNACRHKGHAEYQPLEKNPGR